MVSPSTPDTERSLKPTLDAESEQIQESLWRVIVHNDDVTPVDFVIAILVRVFKHPIIIAEAIMWEAHHKGLAQVATLPRAEAQRRVAQAHFAATLEGYPLHFTLEPV